MRKPTTTTTKAESLMILAHALWPAGSNPNMTHTVLIRGRDIGLAVFGSRTEALTFAISHVMPDAKCYRAAHGVFFENPDWTVHVAETRLGAGAVTWIA